MKKYVKPEIFIEQFELSKHIADCAWELTNSNKDTCSAKADPKHLGDFFVNKTLFVSQENSCDYGPHNDYEGYCYQNGKEGVNVFAS